MPNAFSASSEINLSENYVRFVPNKDIIVPLYGILGEYGTIYAYRESIIILISEIARRERNTESV